jgi:hypothetical protein
MLLTLKEADLRLGLKPGQLANEFYFGHVTDELCIFVGGRRARRAIPEANIERIATVLRRAGRLPATCPEPIGAASDCV